MQRCKASAGVQDLFKQALRPPPHRAVSAGGVLASFVEVCAAGLSVQESDLHTNRLNMTQSTQVITKVGCIHPSVPVSFIMLRSA